MEILYLNSNHCFSLPVLQRESTMIFLVLSSDDAPDDLRGGRERWWTGGAATILSNGHV